MLTKFIRVAVEGATSDGRTLSRIDLEQMGKNYNSTKYGARIWLEHIRGILPDSQFKAYGDVVETKTEEVEIDGVKKLALFAKLDVTDELVGFNKKRQKIYSSIEIQPNFAKTGEAYLVGLGVTDTPASLGTEAIKLFSGRKQDAENLFTEAVETTFEFEEEAKPNLGVELFNKVKALIGIKDKTDAENFTGLASAVEIIATSQKTLIDNAAAQTAAFNQFQTDVKKITDDAAKFSLDFTDLKAELEKQPNYTTKRPAATGSDGKVATDC